MRGNRVVTLLIVGLIVVTSVVLRLYRIDNPVADWHSWRQADTASVTREFVENGYDLLRPRFHDLSNVPSGLDNPEGYRFVEFPIYNLLSGVLYQTVGAVSLEVAGRIVTILASTLSALFLLGIVKRYFGLTAGAISGLVYATLPFSVYFGRVILPDPLMTMSFLGAIYFFILWLDGTKVLKKSVFFAVSLIFAMCSLLLKPFAGFFLLPLAVLSFQTFGFAMLRTWQMYVYAVLAVVPLILWRNWMLSFPEGIPVNEWLFNGGDIRFTGAYFFWIFADRIGRLILGYYGIALILIGLLMLLKTDMLDSLRKGKAFVAFSFLLSSLLYLVVIARGNVQHDYYQIPIVPSLVMVLGIGGAYLWQPPKEYNRFLTRALLIIFMGCMLFFGWYHVRDFFNINNPNIVIAGEATKRLTPEDAKVVTFYDGDTSFLYQTHRRGWSSLQDPLPVLIEKGAEYLAIVNPSDEDREGVGSEYGVVESTEEYLILDLQVSRK